MRSALHRCLVVPLLITASCSTFELEDSFIVTEELALNGPVTLEVGCDVGSIEVGEDPSLEGIEVRGTVRLTGRDEEGALARFEQLGASIQRGADGYVVTPTFEGGRQKSERINLRVRVPDLGRVRLKTNNGSLVASDASDGVEADSSNGTIELIDCRGDVRLSTGNGPISLTGGSGAVRASTGNGLVRVTDFNGLLDLETSNGGVDVSLSDDAKGAVQLRSSNGSINLSVADGWSGVIEASTGNGQVRFRDQDGMRQKGKASILAVGAGGARSVARTGNGSIEVEVRPPGLPRGPRL